jgi:hypothetical protein
VSNNSSSKQDHFFIGEGHEKNCHLRIALGLLSDTEAHWRQYHAASQRRPLRRRSWGASHRLEPRHASVKLSSRSPPGLCWRRARKKDRVCGDARRSPKRDLQIGQV